MRCTPTTVPFIIAMSHCALDSNVRNSSQTVPPWLDNASRWCSVFSEAPRPHRGGDAPFLMDLDSSSWCTSVMTKSACSVHPGSCRQTDGEGLNTRKNLVTSQRSSYTCIRPTCWSRSGQSTYTAIDLPAVLLLPRGNSRIRLRHSFEGCFEAPCHAVHEN